jgi:hypothetical protein
MAIVKLARVMWAMAAVGAWIGCGGDSASQGTTGPSGSVALEAQKAQVGANSVPPTVNAANNAVVESGAPGTTTSGPKSAQSASTPTPSFSFQASINVTVDLGALDASGQPLYPNASGKFSVSATGALTGDPSAGTATYAVVVIWLTDGVFTDPVCGAQATIAAGSQLSYGLVVQWTYTDALNWSILATSDTNGAGTVTVTNASGTWTVNGTVQRHASLSISRSAGTYSLTLSVSGLRTLVVTSAGESHSVIIDVQALDRIVITVDGVPYGPYTVLQVKAIFQSDCQP